MSTGFSSLLNWKNGFQDFFPGFSLKMPRNTATAESLEPDENDFFTITEMYRLCYKIFYSIVLYSIVLYYAILCFFTVYHDMLCTNIIFQLLQSDLLIPQLEVT